MAASDELQALVKVSSEIDESDIKITYANQCIKGQEHLSNRLKQEIQRREQHCHFLNNDNRKLETEIKLAENEIKSSSVSLEGMNTANIELRKELLLAKESYVELVERVKDGEKKYDDLWLQAKQRYESIPFVQEWMEATKQLEILQSRLNILDNEEKMLEKDIIKKKELVLGEERREIIKLAEFLVQRKDIMKTIKEKRDQVAELSKEVEMIKLKRGFRSGPVPTISSPMPKLNLQEVEQSNSGKMVDENWCNISKNIYDDGLMIPRLHLPSIDNDVLDVKLDIKKVASLVTPVRRTASITEFDKNSNKPTKSDETFNDDYMSCYFSKSKPVLEADTDGNQEKADRYAKRKLINILDDMKLDDIETSNILAKVNPDSLQEVDVIRRESPKETPNDTVKVEKAKGPIESDIIEEIDLTNRSSQNLLLPPSQFVDYEEFPDAQLAKSNVKKTVSFDIPTSSSVQDISDDIMSEVNDSEVNVTIASETSEVAGPLDDNYRIMKEMLLKKHHLDLSPQFFYAKNVIHKTETHDSAVKSKFFESYAKDDDQITVTQKQGVTKMETVDDKNVQVEEATDKTKENPQEGENVIEMEDNSLSGSNHGAPSGPSEEVAEKPVAGLLFSHGPRGIPDSLDVSMSTTGYEEGDGDFLPGLAPVSPLPPIFNRTSIFMNKTSLEMFSHHRHQRRPLLDKGLPQSPPQRPVLRRPHPGATRDPHQVVVPPSGTPDNTMSSDSSLLLSPKADHEMQAMSGNIPDISQEVPNFLAGFKKAGLSFFKPNPTVENPDPNEQKQENNFNFNFGNGLAG